VEESIVDRHRFRTKRQAAGLPSSFEFESAEQVWTKMPKLSDSNALQGLESQLHQVVVDLGEGFQHIQEMLAQHTLLLEASLGLPGSRALDHITMAGVI